MPSLVALARTVHGMKMKGPLALILYTLFFSALFVFFYAFISEDSRYEVVRGGDHSDFIISGRPGGRGGGEGKASLSRHRSGDYSETSSRSRDALAR